MGAAWCSCKFFWTQATLYTDISTNRYVVSMYKNICPYLILYVQMRVFMKILSHPDFFNSEFNWCTGFKLKTHLSLNDSNDRAGYVQG